MVVKKNEKKHYYSFGDDTHSIKDLIEEKRKEMREFELRLKNLPKDDLDDVGGDEGDTEKDRIKRQIKRLEKEIKNLQRKL